MTKICILTDTHFGARNDSLTFDDYFYKFYENIFFPYLEKHQIKTVCHLGDIVDRRKFINYVIAHRLKNRIVKRLHSMGIDFHCIVGNHDVPYRNTNDVNALQEWFGGWQNDYIKLYSKPATVEFDGVPILMMPWINNSNQPDAIEAIEQSNAQICFGHLEIAGYEMNRGVIAEHGLAASMFDKFDMVLSGHFHHKSSKGNIHYLGTAYEITWQDWNTQKGFHVFDTETRELEFIINPYKMFHKINYNDKLTTLEAIQEADYTQYTGTVIKVIIQEKNNPYWFDQFMDRLEKADPFDIRVVDDFKDLDRQSDTEIINEAEDTLTILNKVVDQLPEKVDKGRLVNLFQTLYTEALELEV